MISEQFKTILFPQSKAAPPTSYQDALRRRVDRDRMRLASDIGSLADLAKQPGLIDRLQAILNPASA